MSSERIGATAYSHAVAVTPSDSTALTTAARALWVGGAGAVKVDTVGGETGVTLSGVAAGTLVALGVTKVYATGTTATLVVALR